MKNRILFLPLTVSNYKDRQEGVLATWGKDLNIQWLDKENGFANIPLDLIVYITKEIPLGGEYQWYVFCDDDSHIFTSRLVDVLDDYGSDQAIALGDLINTHGGYHSGACIAVSHAAMLALRQYLTNTPVEDLPIHYNHDVTLGNFCRTVGIKLGHLDGIYGTHPWALGHNEDMIRRALCYNHIAPLETHLKLIPYHDSKTDCEQ